MNALHFYQRTLVMEPSLLEHVPATWSIHHNNKNESAIDFIHDSQDLDYVDQELQLDNIMLLE